MRAERGSPAPGRLGVMRPLLPPRCSQESGVSLFLSLFLSFFKILFYSPSSPLVLSESALRNPSLPAPHQTIYNVKYFANVLIGCNVLLRIIRPRNTALTKIYKYIYIYLYLL